MAERPRVEGLAERLLDGAPYVVLRVAPDGEITWVNDAVPRVFGVPAEEALGRNILDYIDLDWNPLAVESIGAALEGSGLRRPMLFKVVADEGRTFIAEVTANSQMDDPVVAGLAVYIRRWDERMLLDQVLDAIAANAPLDDVLELVVAVMGAETLEADGAVLHRAGRSGFRAAVRARGLVEALAAPVTHDGAAAGDEPWHRAWRTGEPRVVLTGDLPAELATAATNAGYRCCWAFPVPGSAPPHAAEACLVLWRRDADPPDHTCLMAVTRLVRLTELLLERHESEQQLRFAATHDPLTGLHNRAAFFNTLQDVLEDPSTGPFVGVLYLDLDGFKPVNDVFGHGAGDRVLAEVGRRLHDVVRRSEHVARLGGDEFAVLCARVASAAETEALAARLVEAISAPFAIGDEDVRVGVSVGISLAPPGACSIDLLVDAADRALYEVKSSTKGGWSIVPVADPRS